MTVRMPRHVDGLIERPLEGETIVVDGNGLCAMSLNATAASVFALCDGVTGQREAKRLLGAELVEEALELLVEAGLVQHPEGVAGGVTRRQALFTGAGALALAGAAPAIAMVALPQAANAASVPVAVAGTAPAVTAPGTTASTTVTRSATPASAAPAVNAVSVVKPAGGSQPSSSEPVGSDGSPGVAALAYTGADTSEAAKLGGALVLTGAAALAASRLLRKPTES